MRFTVFGIPVRVDFFFVIGLVMIWSWAGSDRQGLFAAALVGVLTLVHELGHALTARRYGAQTSITLNLLVGWASYATPRPLTRRQTNTISLAGPLAQIVLCIPLLVVTYYLLPDARSEDAARIAQGRSNLAFDLWQGAVWAGVVIGLLNLLPLWPLDGGHVLDSFLTKWLGEVRGRRTMLIGTLVLVGVVAALGFSASNIEAPYNGLEREIVNAGIAPYSALYKSLPAALWDQVRYFPGHVLDFPLLLLIFCGLNSFLALRQLPRHGRAATWMETEQARSGSEPGAAAQSPPAAVLPPRSASSPDGEVPPAVMDVERRGWIDGVAVGFPHGWGPSPWLQAEIQLRAGHEAEARVLLAHVTTHGRLRWWLPDPQTRPELARLTPLLADQIEVGDHGYTLTLLGVLARYGSAQQIATVGVGLYNASHEPEALYLVAGGLARCGEVDDAMAWLERAVQDRPDRQRLLTDPLLTPLHSHPAFPPLLNSAL